jgi:hypothetical protein
VLRPEFRGERVVSRLTGEVVLYYPRWKRILKRCVTIPVLGAQLLVMTSIIVCLCARRALNLHRSLNLWRRRAA